jgi:hypothetical protein
MQHKNTHLSDQDLLLSIDGELSTRDAGRVQEHLSACWKCRVRKQEVDGAIGDFIRVHQQSFDSQLPPAAGPRALLKAQLAGLAGARSTLEWIVSWRLAAVVCGLLVIGFFIGRFWTARPYARMVAVIVPNPGLTPGATVLMSPGEVCRGSNTKNKPVPVSLQRQVFEAYGISRAEPRAYEIDYLITPALGGADDIRNLWPESYSNTLWNAHVKDALEDHLHDLVCEGKLDLSTAQHEIAGNWIEAYKKYFHTDRPIDRTP